MENYILGPIKPIKRKRPRYRSKAQVYITNVLTDAVLKNISVRGCCITSKNQADIRINQTYIIHVLPENTAKLGKFELLVQARWIRSGADSVEIGFGIISSPILFLQYQQLCLKSRS